MKNTIAKLTLAVGAVFVLFHGSVRAEDVYYVKSINDLKFDGAKPTADTEWAWRYSDAPGRYIAIDGEAEAYLAWLEPDDVRSRIEPADGEAADVGNRELRGSYLAVRVSERRKITGRLMVPAGDDEKPTVLRFSIPADEGKADGKTFFLLVKREHYASLQDRGIPGTAWFRHEVREANRALGLDPDVTPSGRSNTPWQRANQLEASYALASGGRAVSENLQLDRLLPEADATEASVPLDTIEGITVREFDWTPLVKDLDPKLDPLAKLIPNDQHALFFPSFAALVALAEHAQEQSVPVIAFAQPRAESAQVRQRYERQLGLSLDGAAKLLGPSVIQSVALTGGDPYFRTGADVAVIFEPKVGVAALKAAIDAQVALSARNNSSAKPVEGKIDGTVYTGWRSPDRAVCSYVAAVGGAVVVTNSPVQLERLVATSKNADASLAALPEYRFFRDRYRLGEENETALLILSDKTIRRWCGPQWRIATSRRTRAVALMTEMQAAQLDLLVLGMVPTSTLDPPRALPDAGRFTLSNAGVTSETYGTLDFQTPTIELNFDRVTTQEADFYRRWRDGYQRNWSNFFDPIAIRFSTSQEKLAADLTVMPLIDASDYQPLVEASQGAKINPAAGDPHAEAMVHATLALNRKTLAQRWGTLAEGLIRVDPFSWMGETFAMYVDQDPFWLELAKADDPQDYMSENVHRLPLAVYAEVSNGLKLTLFLTAVRAFLEQTAPDMTVWETKRHSGQAYVKIGLSESGRSQVPDEAAQLAIYYAASGEALVLTLNEDVLKRAIDRQIARRDATRAGQPLPQAVHARLGESFCVQVDRTLVKLLETVFAEQYNDEMQGLCWSNLPILNEWHRRYPGRDPVVLHEQFWQRRLICPGGGEYRWNDDWQTMESTVYGHPGEPQDGPRTPPSLSALSFANFGITFEEHGLRARVELELAAQPTSEQ